MECIFTKSGSPGICKLKDLNIEEAKNLIRIFGAKFEKYRSPFKLLGRDCKYGFNRSTLSVMILVTKYLTSLLPTTFITIGSESLK